MPIPKVLLLDVETAPNLSYVWGRWEQNVIDVHTHWYMLSFAWKWKGEKKTKCLALPDFPAHYTKDPENDKPLMEALWDLLHDADIVIAHNGDAFDLKKATARFLFHKIAPPSPFKTIDTLKMARKFFKMDSNRLDDLGAYLGVGRKIAHTGKHLWFGCMHGKKSSWATMKRYNKHDVELLERVFERMKPWATNLPDFSIYGNHRGTVCPTCQSNNVVKEGVYHSKKLKYQQWSCRVCGHWFHGERLK